MKKMMIYCLLAIISVLFITSCDKSKDPFNQEKPPIAKQDSVVIKWVIDIQSNVTLTSATYGIAWPPDKYFGGYKEGSQKILTKTFYGDEAAGMIGKEASLGANLAGNIDGLPVYIYIKNDVPVKKIISKGLNEVTLEFFIR